MKFKSNLLFAFTTAIVFSSCSNVKVSTSENYEAVNFPDGSFAYLNKNSSIEYEKNFTERTVKQTGEVFYEVKKGDNPFIVETELGEIKVLGTQFNVKSSKEDLEVEVESGSVEMKVDKLVKTIKKDQKAIFKEVEKDIKQTKAELKHKQWINDLKNDFKKLGKEIAKDSKQLKSESKKTSGEIKQELNKFKKKLR